MNLKKIVALALSVMMLTTLFVFPASAANEIDWGVTSVTVDEASHTWKIDLYINNPGSEFSGDAWFGIYDRSVDQATFDNAAVKGNVGFSAWDYIWPSKTVASGKTTFSISNTNSYYLAGVNNPGNMWLNTYPMTDSYHYDLTGCENLKVILFYTDGMGGYGYQMAGEINVSLKEVVETEPVVTEAPATDAPATDAPATDAPATDAPATDAPATDAPATDAPATDAPATDAAGTDAATSAATSATTSATEEKGGCGSAIAMPAMLLTLIGGAVLSVKKSKR